MTERHVSRTSSLVSRLSPEGVQRATRYEKRETRYEKRGAGHAVARAVTVAALAVALASGCGVFQTTAPEESAPAPVTMQLLAVLPIEPAPAPSDGGRQAPLPSAEAGVAITAQLYRVLADQTEFRFVPDLTVDDVVETPAVRRAGSLVDRAIALGKEVGADGVIFGRVFRYQKRVGTEYGASQPASVWFDLALVAVSTGDVVWQSRFDQTQEPLTSNLLNWWMFWRAGPRWFSASELAGLGIDRLFEDLTASVNREG